jgi:NitT/TauT family transport system substrate-binding protein
MLTSISSNALERPQPSKTLTKVTLLTDYLTFGRHAAIYAARDLGYFADEGIDIDIQPGKGSNDVITRLGAGQADIGQAGMPSVIAATLKGLKAKMFLIAYSTNGDAVFSLKSSHINEPKDLIGKTIGMAAGTSIAVLFDGLLKVNGIDPSEVNQANIAAQALNPALVSGKIDAMLEFNFNIALLEPIAKTQDKDATYFMFADHGFKYYSNGFSASDEFIAKHPDLVRGVAAALAKGYEFASAHPEQVCAMMHKAVPDVTIKACEGEQAVMPQLINSPYAAKFGFGYMDPGMVQQTIETVTKAQGLTGTVRAADIYTDAFVQR